MPRKRKSSNKHKKEGVGVVNDGKAIVNGKHPVYISIKQRDKKKNRMKHHSISEDRAKPTPEDEPKHSDKLIEISTPDTWEMLFDIELNEIDKQDSTSLQLKESPTQSWQHLFLKPAENISKEVTQVLPKSQELSLEELALAFFRDWSSRSRMWLPRSSQPDAKAQMITLESSSSAIETSNETERSNSTDNNSVTKLNRRSKRGKLRAVRYKTELCRSYKYGYICWYGSKCCFAHSIQELRVLWQHPYYKTELCRTYHSNGFCHFGRRCFFIHNEPRRTLDFLRNYPFQVPERELFGCPYDRYSHHMSERSTHNSSASNHDLNLSLPQNYGDGSSLELHEIPGNDPQTMHEMEEQSERLQLEQYQETPLTNGMWQGTRELSRPNTTIAINTFANWNSTYQVVYVYTSACVVSSDGRILRYYPYNFNFCSPHQPMGYFPNYGEQNQMHYCDHGLSTYTTPICYQNSAQIFGSQQTYNSEMDEDNRDFNADGSPNNAVNEDVRFPM